MVAVTHDINYDTILKLGDLVYFLVPFSPKYSGCVTTDTGIIVKIDGDMYKILSNSQKKIVAVKKRCIKYTLTNSL